MDDLENAPGRIKTGWPDELNLENLKPRESYYSADWEGLGIGYASADFTDAARAIITARYVKNKQRWANMTQPEREEQARKQRVKRAGRNWDGVRQDSINRKGSDFFRLFEADREEGWRHFPDDEIAEMDRIDNATSQSLALRWRLTLDEKRFYSLIKAYAAWLENASIKTIQKRAERSEGDLTAAELVFVADARAVDIVVPDWFDADSLHRRFGDDLAVKMNTPRSDAERREWLINAAEKFYRQGNLFPPYVADPLLGLLDDVMEILIGEGVIDG